MANLKIYLSSDCNLKLGYMKLEWLVIVYHNKTVNTILVRVQTARQAPRVGFSGIYRELLKLVIIIILKYI